MSPSKHIFPANSRLLHGLIHRTQLPVHGEREAEQAPRVPVLPQHIVGVQVESCESPAAQDEAGEQPQSALH